jgi:hypothetical protein
MKLKKIFYSFILCIIATLYIILEIYIVKNSVAVSDMLVRYVSAIIIGFIFEKYLMILEFLPNSRKYRDIKKSNSVIKVWIKSVFLYGVFYWGLGVGTFLLLGMKFVFGFSNIDIFAVAFTYIVSLIGGFIAGNLIFFILLGISIYSKKHNFSRK